MNNESKPNQMPFAKVLREDSDYRFLVVNVPKSEIYAIKIVFLAMPNDDTRPEVCGQLVVTDYEISIPFIGRYFVEWIAVNEPNRRQRIATRLMEVLKTELGEIEMSEAVTPEGEAFLEFVESGGVR